MIIPPLHYFNVTSLAEARNLSSFYGHSWMGNFIGMKNQMDDIDYDIAVIVAGAYGISLGAHAKSMGKVAVVLGVNVGPIIGH